MCVCMYVCVCPFDTPGIQQASLCVYVCMSVCVCVPLIPFDTPEMQQASLCVCPFDTLKYNMQVCVCVLLIPLNTTDGRIAA